ncbi:OmpA family protein [Vibrio algivorus]|uniref:OmpA family protein n=2 Tax=Vibrio algivorus TaxID=1667024 RepID=A0A557P596_9VIBR|nr:OmpA family protein [Vibrio algivorus]TVO35797.1 OmpA family protein [Vibrio algivorus]GLT14140.1 porin OmpA [Vibrio algivorus]
MVQVSFIEVVDRLYGQNNFIVGANMNIKRISLYPSVASIISLSLLMSPQVNAAAENAGEFYLGAKTGWSNFDFSQNDGDIDDDAWAGSVYGGYQFNEWFSLEGGYNYLGNSKEHIAGSEVNKTQIQNGEVGAKLDWNLTSAWNLFGKVGTSYNYVDQKTGAYNDSDENWSLMLGAGVEYQLSHNWRIRSEYQWFDNVGENSTTGRSDVNYLSLGLSYYFGSSDNGAAATAAAATTAAVVATQEPEPEPVVEPAPPADPIPAVTLSKGAFEHDSTELTPEAKSSLDQVVTHLKESPETRVDVIGYTDSTGSAEYNQKLSEKRAQSASDYLESQGIEESRITTIGKGEEDPIADNSTAEGREHNRRVEVLYE